MMYPMIGLRLVFKVMKIGVYQYLMICIYICAYVHIMREETQIFDPEAFYANAQPPYRNVQYATLTYDFAPFMRSCESVYLCNT
jgi:hypothetical protein